MKWTSVYRRLLAFVYILICFAGLMWQLIEVSIEYFKYETSTGIRIHFPDEVTFPDISVCLRYTDILKFDELNKQTNRSYEFTVDDDRVRMYQQNLTLSQIFSFTPSVNDTLSSIVYRHKQSYKRYICHGNNECTRIFTIDKYYYLEYMCYRYTSNQMNSSSVSFSTIAVTPSSPGTIFKLTFNRMFSRVSYMKISLHSVHLYPFRSLRRTPVTRRYYERQTDTAKYNTFVSYQSKLTTHYLPSPYVTRCIDYSHLQFDSSAHCQELCVNNHTLRKLGKVPFSVILTNHQQLSTSLHALSYNDVANESISHKLLHIESMCQRKVCHLKDCNVETVVTHTSKEPGSQLMVLRVILPYTPYINVKHVACIQFVAFLTFILSTISTWTGVCILRINPFTSYFTPLCIKSMTSTMRQQKSQINCIRKKRKTKMRKKNLSDTNLSIDLFRLTETVHEHATRIKRLELS